MVGIGCYGYMCIQETVVTTVYSNGEVLGVGVGMC